MCLIVLYNLVLNEFQFRLKRKKIPFKQNVVWFKVENMLNAVQ